MNGWVAWTAYIVGSWILISPLAGLLIGGMIKAGQNMTEDEVNDKVAEMEETRRDNVIALRNRLQQQAIREHTAKQRAALDAERVTRIRARNDALDSALWRTRERMP